jgi:16S rRNA (cytosine967-C5)-methyltransferase
MIDTPKSGPDRLASRDVAFHVVRDVFGPENRNAQAAFDVRARRAGLDARDRAFAAELAYGSIKMRRLIDWLLQPYLGSREKPPTPAIADVIRLGVYQLRFMSGVDDHAAVSETVNLAWRHGHKGTAGLVNAVLRRMLADGPREMDPAAFKSEDDYLGVLHSVPTWIAAQFRVAYGADRDAALAGVNRAPQHAIRVNDLRSQPDLVREELAARDIVARTSPFVAESLVTDAGTLGDDPGGRWSVQAEAACMPVDLLDPRPGESVLEFCSGRGNKTVQIAARLSGEGGLVCVEIDERKARVWRDVTERAGVENAALVVGDATSAAPDVRAIAVLLDAPCSGTGTIGRHPEARWRKTPQDGERLAVAQSELLRAAAERTAPGARLVYSVCSSDVREGRNVVDAFLAAAPAWTRRPLPERYASLARDGDVVIAAGVDGRDGFYIALVGRDADA